MPAGLSRHLQKNPMTAIASPSLFETRDIESRATEVFNHDLDKLWRGTNQIFFYLLPAQWLACVLGALFISPLTWIGQSSFIHIHVWAAAILGGLITLLPMALIRLMPDKAVTRHVI